MAWYKPPPCIRGKNQKNTKKFSSTTHYKPTIYEKSQKKIKKNQKKILKCCLLYRKLLYICTEFFMMINMSVQEQQDLKEK